MPKQNTSPAEYPHAVLQQIERLGQHIAIARKRRGETQAQWAQRLGVSQPTMARIERGDPSVAMASYVMCLWLVNPAVAVADLIAPHNDQAALEREVARVRRPRKPAQGALPQRAQGKRVPGAASASTSASAVARTANSAAAGLAALMQPGAAKASQ
jgi:DNA-binding XRE family transcriptional regulator